jgi:ERCC4-type nuclease
MTTDLLGRNSRGKNNVNTSPPKVTPITILQDTREQTPWKFGVGVTVERVTLAAGDYSVKGHSDRVAIERKSIDDLAQTISWGRNRFEEELKLLMQYEYRAILVEANLADVLEHRYESFTHPSAVVGSSVAFWHDANCPTLWLGNARNCAMYAERMFRRMVEKCQQKA